MITVEKRRFLGTNEALRELAELELEENAAERKEREKKKGREEKSLWDPRPTQPVNQQTMESHGKTIHFWLDGLDSTISSTKREMAREKR